MSVAGRTLFSLQRSSEVRDTNIQSGSAAALGRDVCWDVVAFVHSDDPNHDRAKQKCCDDHQPGPGRSQMQIGRTHHFGQSHHCHTHTHRRPPLQLIVESFG
jgi:hypothetical protein